MKLFLISNHRFKDILNLGLLPNEFESVVRIDVGHSMDFINYLLMALVYLCLKLVDLIIYPLNEVTFAWLVGKILFEV